jgi:hypothetical protein
MPYAPSYSFVGTGLVDGDHAEATFPGLRPIGVAANSGGLVN